MNVAVAQVFIRWRAAARLIASRYPTAGLFDRVAKPADVDAIINEWTSRHTKHEVMELLGRCDIPAGAVLDTVEISSDEHLRRNGTFVTVRHPARGEFVMPAWPVQMSASSVSVTAAPLLGQHTDEVLRQVGVSDEELTQLRASCVI